MSDSITKWVERLKNKPRIRGVHERLKPFGPGVSCAGSYIQLGGSTDTCKRLHREVLEDIKLMSNIDRRYI